MRRAYAVIAYQTAYLKANYPVEFIAASMTYDMNNTDKLGIFREEAAHFGISLLPPDINKSEVLFSVEEGSIRYALAAIRNVGAQAMEGLVRERLANGPYKDIFDCVMRIPSESLNRRALEYLIKAGAFDGLHPNRRQMLEHIELIMSHGLAAQRDRESSQVSLFGGAGAPVIQKPSLPAADDWSSLQRLEHEFEAIGFYLSSHPLAGYKLALEQMTILSSANFAHPKSSPGNIAPCAWRAS